MAHAEATDSSSRFVGPLLVALIACCVITAPLAAAEPGLRAVIDREVAAAWQKQKITPAPTADDAEFLRRVYLDLCGQIATHDEARDFLADKDPEKRAKLVDRLLADPDSPSIKPTCGT